MKDNALFIAAVLIAFIFGFLTAYLWQSKQQLDQVMNPSVTSVAAVVDSQHLDNPKNNLPNLAVENNVKAQTAPLAMLSNATSLNDFSSEQALNIVNDMPDYMLGQYIDKFMAKGASDAINDKRQFAQRAVEELYSKNDNQPLVGNIKLSLSSEVPASSVSTAMLNKNAKLFAHLDTSGKVPASPFVFVKWVNNQTGQVLLFEKKDIVANRNQNWVSFRPYDGWSAGSYDIRFYQFTSELQPIAQLTYDVYEVID
ncbi:MULTISPECIES: hypothetical protein [Psychrobacter]|uniref:hypothetical protein n=1 Tax=Psychrobacter TaxID=497 RepID=UPI00146A5695|nr:MULTISPECIES: hypothetical protein [Psychrobacter]